MSERHEDAGERSDGADRWLELQLEEEYGSVQPPDLREQLLASSSAKRARAAQAMAGGQTRSVWLAAAVIVIGIATVFAVLQGKYGQWTVEKPHGGANGRGESQDPAAPPEQVLPKDLADFQRLVKTAKAASVTAGITSLPNSMRHLVEANRTPLHEPEDLKLLFDELQKLTPLDPAGWLWENEIRIDLPGNRCVRVAVYRHGDRRLGVGGLGDFQMSEALHDLLAPLVDGVARMTTLRAGNVMSREDLLLTGEVSIPRDIRELRCRGLADDDLALLQAFGELRVLDLSGCQQTIAGPGLKHLLALPNLQKLKLRYSKVRDEHVALLGAHATLRELDLSSHQLTGTCMAAFAASTSLRTLVIGWSKTLTDEGMAAIAKVASLGTLSLSGRSVGALTTAGLSQIGTMQNLHAVYMDNLPAAMDEVFAALGALPKLQELKVSFTNVSNVGLAALRARRAADANQPVSPLRVLDLTGCKNLQEGVLEQLGGFVHLQHLDLARTSLRSVRANGEGTKDDFSGLLRLHDLQDLDVSGTRLDAQACRNISRLPSLHWLNMSFCGDAVDDEAVRFLSEAQGLTHLELSGCDGFGDEGLRSLAALSKLSLLDVNVCDGITAVGVEAFRARRPACELRLPDALR